MPVTTPTKTPLERKQSAPRPAAMQEAAGDAAAGAGPSSVAANDLEKQACVRLAAGRVYMDGLHSCEGAAAATRCCCVRRLLERRHSKNLRVAAVPQEAVHQLVHSWFSRKFATGW